MLGRLTAMTLKLILRGGFVLTAEENALLYINSYFHEDVEYKKEFYGVYRVIFSDGELYVSAGANQQVTVKDYDTIDESYRLIDPTHFAPYERIE